MSKPVAESPNDLTFDGSSWTDFQQVMTRCEFHFRLTPDMTASDVKSAYLLSFARGDALIWLGEEFASKDSAMFDDYDGLIKSIRLRYLWSDLLLKEEASRQLRELKWSRDLPLVLAELEHLFRLCKIEDDDSRQFILKSKLPKRVHSMLAMHGQVFNTYSKLTVHLQAIYAMEPELFGTGPPIAAQKANRERCGKCNKKGHTTSEHRDKIVTKN